MFCIIVVSGCLFFVAISLTLSQIKTVELNISITNSNKLFLLSNARALSSLLNVSVIPKPRFS